MQSRGVNVPDAKHRYSAAATADLQSRRGSQQLNGSSSYMGLATADLPPECNSAYSTTSIDPQRSSYAVQPGLQRGSITHQNYVPTPRRVGSQHSLSVPSELSSLSSVGYDANPYSQIHHPQYTRQPPATSIDIPSWSSAYPFAFQDGNTDPYQYSYRPPTDPYTPSYGASNVMASPRMVPPQSAPPGGYFGGTGGLLPGTMGSPNEIMRLVSLAEGGVDYDDPAVLKLLRSKKRKKSNDYKCLHCGKAFAGTEVFARHLDKYSLIKIQQPVNEGSRGSASSGSSSGSSDFPVSVTTVEGTKMNVCMFKGCGRMFKRKDSLRRHLRLVHENQNSRFNQRLKIQRIIIGDIIDDRD